MARRIFVCRGGKMVEVPRVHAVHLSDAERLLNEGSQGERVLRGYRDLEQKGAYSRKPGTDSADTIKRAWAGEVSGRFN